VDASYEGEQVVGLDVHRRRSVLVRMTESGRRLETVRITNDPQRLAEVMARAGEALEVVLEATYGWYWAADTLAELGASVHLAHPLRVKAFWYRRVNNDERDAADLADLLRMGRLPEAWIAPPATRELRELEGHELLRTVNLASASRARIDSARRMIDMLDWEVELFANLVAGRLRADPGYRAIQAIPGVGPTLAAVLVAEIGDVTRFQTPAQLASWAGLTPRHHESDTTVHRGRITKQGSRLVRWAAVEAAQHAANTEHLGVLRERVAARRGRNIATVAAARKLLGLVFYGLRDHDIRALHTAPRAGAA